MYIIATKVPRYRNQPPKQPAEILKCEPPFLTSRALSVYRVATARAQNSRLPEGVCKGL